MDKSQHWKSQRQALREAKRGERPHVAANRQSNGYAQWFGNRRPVIAAKSYEGLLAKLRRNGKLRPRAVQLYEAWTKRMARAVEAARRVSS